MLSPSRQCLRRHRFFTAASSGSSRTRQGRVIPGATVTIVNKETNLTREAITNAEGAYSLINVLPGPYDVKVTLTGFRDVARPNVPVTIGQIARVDFTLEVGTVTETVMVVGESPLLQTDKADVHTELKSAEHHAACRSTGSATTRR